MTMVNVHQAKSQLSKLIEEAEAGEDVVIARAGKPAVRLVPVTRHGEARRAGVWRDRVVISPDLDTLPDDLIAAFEGSGE